jgi:hypothetical protein
MLWASRQSHDEQQSPVTASPETPSASNSLEPNTAKTPTDTPKPAPSTTSSTSTKTTNTTKQATPPASTPTPTPPAPSTPAGSCTNPYYTTSNSNGGVSDGGFYVHNNLWNASKYPGTTGTTAVCSYHSWNHTAVASNTSGNGEVKTYPNVHKDFSGRTISSFTQLSSSFAATSPSVGIYDVAYDLWLNGVPNDEIMIWTDNYKQVPAGSKFASNVSFSGYSWNIYATSGNGYIAFVPANGVRLTSGTIDIKAMLDYLVSQGRRSASDTVDQVGYGIEIVDTGGVPASWYVTNFSLTHN